ncbi:hypothetical protein SmJEL517_g01313 [Synchytrium microbalum]|uniref:TmcB/TmcC TPR repeats domain-containing protein n=1 Tax=Synchytrium microbalum TaxID=1806994 RepID=A0A507CFY8_9FUNG|nr:uncharacterized protein SmJEL517_g01313 [Synchytrium microbalum]TPX36495.1 hypothetical protein SmJEL517_g01313 [Synchytrium microbalum]
MVVAALRSEQLTSATNMCEKGTLSRNIDPHRKTTARPDEGASSFAEEQVDDTFLMDASLFQRAKSVLFNVLFFTVYGNRSSTVLGLLAILIEDLQIPVFFLSSRLSVVYYVPDVVGNAVETRYEEYGTTLFTAFFGVAVGLVFLTALNILWVAYGFVRGQHKYVWPITTLRLLGAFVPTVLFIPILDILTTSFDCSDSIGPGFESLACTSTTRIPFIIVSVVTIITFLPVTFLINLLFLDADPINKDPGAKTHGRVEIVYAVLKTIVSFVWKVSPDGNMLIKVGVVLGLSLVMLLCSVFYYPYYDSRINHMRIATYFASTFLGLVSMIATVVTFYTGVAQGPLVYIILLSAYFPAWIAGYLGSQLWLNYIQKSTLKRLDAYVDGQTEKPVFWIWPHVEIVARSFIATLNSRNRHPKPQQLDSVLRVFKHGQKEFSHHSYTNVQRATYYLYVGASKNEFNKALKKSEELHPAFDGQFQCHFMSQMNNQNRQATFLGPEIRLDVASFAEFRKLDKTAKVNHQMALQWQRVLWQSVQRSHVTLEYLEAISAELYARSEDANEAYGQLVTRFPKSQTLLRFYAKCLDVTNESAKAAALLARADTLEDELAIDEAPVKGREVEKEDKIPHSRNHSEENLGPRAIPRLQMTAEIESDSDCSGAPPLENSKVETTHSRRESLGSSTSRPEHKQQQLNQQLRASLLHRNIADIRIITGAAWMIGTVSIAIVVASYVVISQSGFSNTGLSYLHWLDSREYLTPLIYRRARQLQDAYAHNDHTTFTSVQSVLAAEAAEFDSINAALLANTDLTQDIAAFYYTQPSTPVLVSFYPTQIDRIWMNYSLYEVGQRFAASGLQLSTMDFASFSNITYNNYFRFIADNFYLLQQEAYEADVNDIYFTKQAQIIQNATAVTIGLTVCLIVVVLTALLILDYRVQIFRSKQRLTLDIFKKVPKGSAHDIIQLLEEAQSEDVFGADTLTFEARSALEMKIRGGSSARLYVRLQTAFYGLTLTVLVTLFAVTNLNGLYDVGQLFAMHDQFSDMITFGARGAAIIKDLVNPDWLTWRNDTYILAALDAQADKWSEAYDVVRYGDDTRYPPSPMQNQYPSDLAYDWTAHICLANDTSICQNRVYNSSFGFTSSLVNSGLIHLSDQLVNLLSNSAIAAENGTPYVSDPDVVAVFDAVFEPDYLDGITRCLLETLTLGNAIINGATVRNSIIFILELLLVCIGSFFVFWRLIMSLRFMENCIVDMIVRLPISVRNLSDVHEFICKLQGQGRTLSKDSLSPPTRLLPLLSWRKESTTKLGDRKAQTLRDWTARPWRQQEIIKSRGLEQETSISADAVCNSTAKPTEGVRTRTLSFSGEVLKFSGDNQSQTPAKRSF